MKQRSWTDEDLSKAIKESYSISSVLQKLGLRAGGGTYDSIKIAIKRLGISTQHFKGKAWNKGRVFINNRRSLDIYLVSHGPSIPSHSLKLRLIRDGIFNHECCICGGKYWTGKPIPIELDHINGDKYDNRLSNLRVLCPNCHAQTDTYCGKNRRIRNIDESCVCSICNKQIRIGSTYCLSHRPHGKRTNKTKIIWPSIEELKSMVASSSFSAVGRQLGVSDSSVRKHILQHRS